MLCRRRDPDLGWCRGAVHEIPSAVLAPSQRSFTAFLALVAPAALALLATTCTATRPAASPPPPRAPAALPDGAALDGMASAPSVEPRRTLLFMQPPSQAPEAGVILPIAPDPPPLAERAQWVYELRYSRGELYLLGVHSLVLPAPRTTPRAIGRFALELYSGHELIERVRFDFPGLGGDPGAGGRDAGKQVVRLGPVSFTAGLTTRVGVMLPATSKGTRLEIWDRATDLRWPLPWPAVELKTEAPDAEVALDAGAAG